MFMLPTWRLLARVFRRGYAMTIPTTLLRFLVFKCLNDLKGVSPPALPPRPHTSLQCTSSWSSGVGVTSKG